MKRWIGWNKNKDEKVNRMIKGIKGWNEDKDENMKRMKRRQGWKCIRRQGWKCIRRQEWKCAEDDCIVYTRLHISIFQDTASGTMSGCYRGSNSRL